MAVETIEAYEYETAFDSDNESQDSINCEHEKLNNSDGITVCMDCGEKIDEALMDNESRYYGQSDTRYAKDPCRHNQRKNEERSCYGDLEAYGFPREVIERANDYYKAIIKDKIYRAGNRISIVFACAYHAFEDVMEPHSPAELAVFFKLDKKGISNGLKIFSKVFRKRPTKKYLSAMDIVPKLLVDLHIDDSIHKSCIEDITTIYNFVMSKSKTFNSSNPLSVAAGLIYYYFKLNSVQMSRVEFSRIVKLTDITFTKLATDIHKVLGSKKELKF
jgi:transcription initiation factor TFIIIB Brf1 subunit/transcription initiation factor TFIIB